MDYFRATVKTFLFAFCLVTVFIAFNGSISTVPGVGSVISGIDYVSGKSGIDSMTEALLFLDYEHHERHDGRAFRVQAFNDAIGAGDTLVVGFRVSDQTREPHFLFEWETEGKATIELLEGATIDAGVGTDVLIKNSYRKSTNTSVLQGYATSSWVSNYVTKDVTYSGGSVVSKKKAYSSSKAGGNSGSRRGEIILKEDDTEYVVILINDEATAKGGQLRLEWYEHAPKN